MADAQPIDQVRAATIAEAEAADTAAAAATTAAAAAAAAAAHADGGGYAAKRARHDELAAASSAAAADRGVSLLRDGLKALSEVRESPAGPALLEAHRAELQKHAEHVCALFT